MNRAVCILAVLGVLCLGASRRFSRPPITSSSASTPAALGVNFLTNLSSTVNTNWYVTGAFTPSTNALITVSVSASPLFFGPDVSALTNIDTPQLTWWRAASNHNSVYSSEFWVSQLPQGTAPGAIKLSYTGTNFTGIELHVYQWTNASQTLAWGTNAIVQCVSTNDGVNSGAGDPFDYLPTASDSNAVQVAAFMSGSAPTINFQTGWTEATETAHGTPALNQTSGYRLQVPASLTRIFLTNTTGGAANMNVFLTEIRAAVP